MRFLSIGFGLALVLTVVSPAPAQYAAKNGALGGGLASSGATTRPLGGIPSPVAIPGRRSGTARGSTAHSPYAYSFYVPNYFDYGSQYAAPYAPVPPPDYDAPPVAAPAAPQPVIINQYFGGPPPQQAAPPEPEPPNNAALTPGDPLSPPQNYYLIAYKNHQIYAALAYWVEDKTLHYVTMQNTHNQASMDLIDLPFTKSLNESRDVQFSVTGQ